MTDNGKIIRLNANEVRALADTGQCYWLSDKTQAILLAVLQYQRWMTRWLGDINTDEISAWVDRATYELMTPCEGTMFDIRPKPGIPCIIQKSSDGVIWTDAFDIRNCLTSSIRRNPATGELGITVEDVGFYRIPDGEYIPAAPAWNPPRVTGGGTDEVERCNAAYAAAAVLQATYQQTWDVFTRWAVESALSLSQTLLRGAELNMGLRLPLSDMVEIARGLWQESDEFTEGGFPDTYLDDVQNILFCEASVTDGKVTFDYAGVISRLGAASGLDPSGPYGGLNLLLQLWLGEAGLNAAGSADYGSGDCSGADCIEPCADNAIIFKDINCETPSGVLAGTTIGYQVTYTNTDGQISNQCGPLHVLKPGSTVTIVFDQMLCLAIMDIRHYSPSGTSADAIYTIGGLSSGVTTRVAIGSCGDSHAWNLPVTVRSNTITIECVGDAGKILPVNFFHIGFRPD